ncbi:hypothetical protein RB614_17125 [Phytohabitans sp. ZYX-F-186]|uniref:Uncharacterized protein n=1 Tax=Phytohabitans maris TaxID=3071409 RepID=A0ABU0ZGR5_9ACTN|nr:hypothetical protein [Phytohabitans sp. ZYX-F-186]MDQ7906237.1 hypothetical protein [Phytohabitans sp. ZYX-F-186]
MNSLPDLLRESLTDLTDPAEMPAGLGERALAAGRRRRRWRTTTVGAAAVAAAAAVALPFTLLAGGEPPTPATARPQNAVFAVRHTEYLAPSARESDVHRWEVLDPATGDYRDALVKTVSEPTSDLRYAAVLPKGDGAQTQAKLGRYETTTGAIRWYDIPIRPDYATISPDGRYAAARAWSDAAQAADIVVVDLETGQVRRFDTASLYASQEQSTPKAEPRTPGLPLLPVAMMDERTPEVAFAPDSRHLLFGTGLTDFDGRLVRTLPLPDDTGFVSVHRGGAGILVRTGLATTDYAVVDETGAIRYGTATGDRTCAETPAPTAVPRCRKPWARFLSWRGTDQILVQTAPDPYVAPGSPSASPAPPQEARYMALDLRTGRQEAVVPPHFDGDGPADDVAHSFVVVISAEALSPSVRERLAF